MGDRHRHRACPFRERRVKKTLTNRECETQRSKKRVSESETLPSDFLSDCDISGHCHIGHSSYSFARL
ncbi:hypothetical protein Q3G72_008717 [Acer saccharum]|nr:hypothetical protein Q3G72_008717 [Acer saccharum]